MVFTYYLLYFVQSQRKYTIHGKEFTKIDLIKQFINSDITTNDDILDPSRVLNGGGYTQLLNNQQLPINIKHNKGNQPFDVKAINVKAIDVKPINVKAINVKPINVKAINVKAIDVKPIDVKPIDVKPIDVKHIDVKPIDVKHIDVKPIDVKISNDKKYRDKISNIIFEEFYKNKKKTIDDYNEYLLHINLIKYQIINNNTRLLSYYIINSLYNDII
jgi:hypothetical protein